MPLGRGRRNLIVRSALVNRPPRRFLSNLARPKLTGDEAFSASRRQYSDTPKRTGRFATSLVLFKRCCPKQQATRTHKHRSSSTAADVRVVGRSEKSNQLSGGTVYRSPLPCQAPAKTYAAKGSTVVNIALTSALRTTPQQVRLRRPTLALKVLERCC